jgi:hypothetical protein
MGWTVLPHSPYSTNLAPYNCHLFGPLKNALQRAETQHVRRVLMLQQEVLCNKHTASDTIVKKSVLIMNVTLYKNNLNSVKDVPMIYVSGERKKKKKRRKKWNYFCTASHT